jgi:hypothetical protein
MGLSHAPSSSRTSTDLVRPAVTLDRVFDTQAVYCPRVSFTTPGWVPSASAVLALVTSRELCIAGTMTVVCSESAVSEEGFTLLAEAGLPMRARVVTFRDREEYASLLRGLASAGRPIVLQHLHAADEVPPASYWIPPSLLSFLNNKGNLAELVPAELVPERRIVVPDAMPAGDVLLRHGPVVMKAASDLSTAAGVAVAICRTPDDVDTARTALAGAERIVLESFLDIRRNVCVHVVVEPDGRARYLGAAEQVCDEHGRYGGNWLDPPSVPPGIEPAAIGITERAAALGYRGFAGFDMAECTDGRLRVLDLNFRLNGSTAAMLLYDELVRTRGLAVMRLRIWAGRGSFAEMVATAREATARKFLVPLSTYCPPGGASAADPPRLLGLVLGTSRDAVRRREEELATCGLV